MEKIYINPSNYPEYSGMDERKVILTWITCSCPKCDRLYDVQRYVEQFAPVPEDSCRRVCVNCMVRR